MPEGIWLINTHGRRVHCLAEYEEELIERGYSYPPPEKANHGEPDTEPAEPEEGDTEGEGDEDPDEGEAPEAAGDDEDLEKEIDVEEIEAALELDNGNVMRSTLAAHVEGSTQGMSKEEIRAGLEELLEQAE